MIEVEKLGKTYGSGPDAVTVLDDVSFTVDPGEIFAIVGPSGAGKSTLAHCLNLLEGPSSGKVTVNNQNLTELGSNALRDARRRIGTVFQSSSLLSRRTAAENVALPLEFLGVPKAQTRSRVSELLDRVGLSDRAHLYPHQLSGGQRQRVGIARALALRPSVLLSDEATSGLDPQTTDSFLELLREVRQELNLAVVFITHEMDTIVKVADSVGRLDSGRIVEKGSLVALLTDSTSTLGRSLRPRGTSADPEPGHRSFDLTYNSAAVPADWISRVGAELSIPIGVLGAAIQVVDGVSVGSVTVSVPDTAAARFLDSAERHGLSSSAVPTPAVEVSV